VVRVSSWLRRVVPSYRACQTPPEERGSRNGDSITLLHLSDPQFGRNHLFGSSGLTVDDQHWDSLFARLHEDLGKLRRSKDLAPEVVVVSGDLAESVAFSPTGDLLASASDDRSIRLWRPQSGTWVATLIPLADGWAVLTPDGRYKLEGNVAGEFWYVAGLCRFEPGELDDFIPSIRRIPADEPLFPSTG
jgi:WD40 repeat protein